MAEPTYKLRIQGLRKTYGSVVALAGADVDIRAGEFLTLLGPSGSGKSTMLMLIAGLIQPDDGAMWIDGKLSTYMPPHKRDIGMVFQNYALFPHMTVYENIAFPLRMRRVAAAKIREEVRRVLDIVQLPDVAERLPRQLSGGQQQRIALARCMAYRPPVILMDEPLGALDKKLREQLQLEIRHLHQALDITVLYVTHDQEEALVMSDRICLMNEGEIAQLGTPDDLYFRPETVFAANFLGESNLLDAVVAGQRGSAVQLQGPNNVTIAAPAREAVSCGQKVKFMVRPENVRLLAPDEQADNTLVGRLQDVILLGQVTKYYAKLPDGTAVSATQLTRHGLPRFQPEAEVRFGFDLESTVVLPLDQHTELP
jgi:putative spermidine/putrescine transport system ATP-binding protein